MASTRRKELNALFKKLSSDLSSKMISEGVQLVKTDDGRSDSIINEKQVINYIYSILSEYENVTMLSKAKVRNWFDFGFEFKGELVPVNLKMTAKFGNDNVSSKKGILWAFSDLEDTSSLSYWPDIKRAFEENINAPFGGTKDYFLLIVNKNDLNDVFHTSIKQIKELSPNANNLPFQANWNKNRELIDRSDMDAYKYVFKIFKDSLDRWLDIASTLDSYNDKI